MESDVAVEALGALAHPTRLALFRLLAAAPDEGLAAGDIAERLDVAPSTLSHHLAALERPGLIRHRRDQRRLLYSVSPPAVGALIAFLTDQCCGGRPDLCGGRS
ncbi:ArsR/SmtB family transcription factor [Sphingobium sp. CCH11-B1]|jgi:DNA-binding transcriptional ArsR family regulator|uniref:ArsR/SmtB family transcription factor n=1 Tax=Sphingobium sp. CCH11-B1 TaxID=1768781 RepID=UPI00082BD72C|nr:helix-turn-helix domain-containing protein [Sphingobium sp. CCH11-B1]MEA3389754.1 helix-turn-helix domain-containing protein [Pseudomonadota bacterium]